MSNRVYLIRTKFTDLADNNVSFGWRMFDDFDRTYATNYGDEEIDLMKGDDLGFLVKIADLSSNSSCQSLSGMIEFAIEHGIDIDGTFYSPEELDAKFNPKESA